MRKFVVFTVLLFLLLNACFEYRVHSLEQRIGYLEELKYKEADALSSILKWDRGFSERVERLEEKYKGF